MSNELNAHTTASLTIYSVLLNSVGQIYNGSTFVTINGANWTSYDIAMTEATAGIYLANMPAVALGAYSYVAYKQLGGTPAITDTVEGTGYILWDGTAEMTPFEVADVWAVATRTLTQSAAAVTAAVAGSDISMLRGDTFSATLTGLSANTGYVSIDFTVKHSYDDLDSAAVIKIRKNASGTGDGLLYINGAAGTAAKGSITVNSATSITITLNADQTDDLVPEEGLIWDCQYIFASTVTTATYGQCAVTADITRAVA